MDNIVKQKRVFIFLDTNLLWNDKKNENFNIFCTFFLKQLIILRNFFLQEVPTTELRIIFPQTVIYERYKQKTDLLTKNLDLTLNTLETLKKIEQFDNDNAITQLKDIQDRLYLVVQTKGWNFIKEYNIIIAPECPNEYFEKIIKKAYAKEKPFDSTKVDGFKDALVWYSIIDYLNKEHAEKEDLIFLFTQNKRDFESENSLTEFKTLVQNDIHIIDFEKPQQICHSGNREFLKLILKEAQTTKIANIRFEYSESERSLVIENIFADPFPSNLVSLVDTAHIRRTDCKRLLKAQVIELLKNFDFNVDPEEIHFEYKKLPNIYDITVFLDFHEEGYYYDIGGIEVNFEDGDMLESDYESIVIPDDCILNHIGPDFEFFKIDTVYNDYIVKMISKQINRKIDPDVLFYTVMG